MHVKLDVAPEGTTNEKAARRRPLRSSKAVAGIKLRETSVQSAAGGTFMKTRLKEPNIIIAQVEAHRDGPDLNCVGSDLLDQNSNRRSRANCRSDFRGSVQLRGVFFDHKRKDHPKAISLKLDGILDSREVGTTGASLLLTPGRHRTAPFIACTFTERFNRIGRAQTVGKKP